MNNSTRVFIIGLLLIGIWIGIAQIHPPKTAVKDKPAFARKPHVVMPRSGG